VCCAATGEVIADGGRASVCGHSVATHLASARRLLGYCPQFSALPGAMTGQEVLRMYARLRGVPPGLIEGQVDSLLTRLDLLQFSNRLLYPPPLHCPPVNVHLYCTPSKSSLKD